MKLINSKYETFYLQTFTTVGLILGYIAAHTYCFHHLTLKHCRHPVTPSHLEYMTVLEF